MEQIQQNPAESEQNQHPPANTLFVNRWDDTPGLTVEAVYEIEATGVTFTAQKKRRRVLEALRRGPLACASRCRLSHYVHELREAGLSIEMTMYEGTASGERYGIYQLKSVVKPVTNGEVTR